MRAVRIRTVLASTRIDAPELAPLVGHRVEVIVQDEAVSDWPAGWFEATAGAIDDPTFVRPPQPETETRPALHER